jgi:drug/metabolite transporter (DMT)-like permease
MNPLVLLLGTGFSIMWSSAFSAARIAVQDAPPLSLLTFRFFASGLIALALGRLLGQRLPRGRRAWGSLVVLGLCQNALYLTLVFIAVQTIPAALAAVIVSTLPLLVAAVSPVITGERPGPLAVVGLLLGFAGVVYILHGRIGGGADVTGIVLCLAAVLALMVATMVVNHGGFGGGLMMVVGVQMLVGSAALLPFALVFESLATVNPTAELALAFAYIVLVPGLLATAVWFSLIGWIGPTRASVFHFLNPGFGILIAWLLLGEPLAEGMLLGATAVAAGILLVQLARLRPAGGPAQKSKE